MKKLGLLATVIAAIAFPAPPSLATDDFVVAIRLEKPSEDFLTVGSTVIEFTSNFVAEIDLDGGPPVSVVLIPLSWEVISGGPATFIEVELKKDGFTKGVTGDLLTAAVGANQEAPTQSVCTGFIGFTGDLFNVVCVPIDIFSLRCSGGSKLVGKGKVHLKMTLGVDFDGQTNIPIGFGINLKLRDPDLCS